MYLQTQSIYNGQRSIYNYNGEKNVKSARIVHYLISCICVCFYMCICVFVHLCICVHDPPPELPTVGQHSIGFTTPRNPSTAFNRAAAANFICHMSFGATTYYWGEPPSFRFSSAWQPASNSLVKPLYQLVYLAWLALTECEG